MNFRRITTKTGNSELKLQTKNRSEGKYCSRGIERKNSLEQAAVSTATRMYKIPLNCQIKARAFATIYNKVTRIA